MSPDAADRDGVRRPRHGASRFWVESPLQLLGAIEAHAAGLTGTTTQIHARAGVPGLAAMAALLDPQLPPGVSIQTGVGEIGAIGRLGAMRWGAGDPFSGLVQRALMTGRSPREVILIDAGPATLSFLHQLAAEHPTPVVRAYGASTGARRALGVTLWWRLRQLAAEGRLTVVSALPLDPGLRARLRGLGVNVESHGFEWLRTQEAEEFFPAPNVVIGSGLAADGLVRAEPYVEWVRSIAQEGAVAYFPHRREAGPTLAALAESHGITVHPTTVPVELRLRGLLPRQAVFALPSVAVPSLRLILGSRGITVHAAPIPEHWWSPAASPTLRAALRASADLPLSPRRAFVPSGSVGTSSPGGKA